MAAGSLVLSFVLALMGKLTAEWTTIVSTVNVAYHGANMLIARKVSDNG